MEDRLILLRCTQKLLKEIVAKSNDALLVEEPATLLGKWYAHMFTLNRRKAIIFMDEWALLSFIVFGYRKSQADQFGFFSLQGLNKY